MFLNGFRRFKEHSAHCILCDTVSFLELDSPHHYNEKTENLQNNYRASQKNPKRFKQHE